MGHARAIAASPEPEVLLRDIVANGLSVRQAEALAKRARPGAGSGIARASARNSQRGLDPDLAALERQLGDMTGLKVKVSHGSRGGTVTLSYSSLDQLDLICQRLSGEPI
jgi:ParB family chromosome partitioning protein